jgi:uncharacterized protein (DUF433 family)
MDTIDREKAFGVGLLGSTAGHTQDDTGAEFFGPFVNGFPFDEGYLTEVWEVDVGIERGPTTDEPGFNAAVYEEYVKKSNGAYRVSDTRVSLDSLVYLFREGMSAESMVESYPALTLEAVHGALAFYLANEAEIDAYLGEGARQAEERQVQSRRSTADLIAKLRRARHENQIPG